jgi:hypothetical protein
MVGLVVQELLYFATQLLELQVVITLLQLEDLYQALQ